MENESVVIEFENIDRYFNGKELMKNQTAKTEPILSDDQWSIFLKAYVNNDQETMAQLIGRIEQLDWHEEEKMLWFIFLVVRCEGSEQYMRELKWTLQKFRHENPMVEELLICAGNILLSRENIMREENYQRELKKLTDIADESAKKTESARKNLQRYE